MARISAPRGKVVRRFGVNLFGNPKFDRLLAKRSNPPGQHGPDQGRKKVSEYGKQLAEKQKLKLTYGLLERQFRQTFERARQAKGITGDKLMIMLEGRLDNVVYRTGWAGSRAQARQLILHGHLKINGRRVNVPSFAVKEGMVISVKDSTRSKALVTRYLEENASRPVPGWLSIDKENLSVRVERLPLREEIQSEISEKLVVELYSK